MMNFDYVNPVNNLPTSTAQDEFTDLGIVMQDFVPNPSHNQSKFSLPVGSKRSANCAGLDHFNSNTSFSSGDCNDLLKSEGASSDDDYTMDGKNGDRAEISNGKKTKGRVKIKMEFIDNKLRRYTTFSKRKTGIMKKAYELSTLTGTQVMLLVASETGHVYTFATRKLQPMITSEAGKALIQTCLNSPDIPASPQGVNHDQRMCATGFEETELSYNIVDDENSKDQDLSASSPEPSSPLSEPESPSLQDFVSEATLKGLRKAKGDFSLTSSKNYPSFSSEISNKFDGSAVQLGALQPMQTFASPHCSKGGNSLEITRTPSPPSSTNVPSSHPTLSYHLSSPPSILKVPAFSDGKRPQIETESDDKVNKSPTHHSSIQNFAGSQSLPSSNAASSKSSQFPTSLPSALMYHTAQGLVYATPTSATLPDGSNVILNFAATPPNSGGIVGMPPDQAQGTPTQQYITIPVPMSLTSPQLVSAAIPPTLLQQQVESIAKVESALKKSSSKN